MKEGSLHPQSTQGLRRAARHPEKAVKMKAIKAETKSRVAEMGPAEIRRCNAFSERKRPSWDSVVKRLGVGRLDLETQG